MNVSRLAKATIKIPKRIERGPTDILKALVSTVKYVPSEPNRDLHDDPYLLPIARMDRLTFPLAKLSGISTAKFLLNKHPELFFRDDAEPKIRAFYPSEEFREDMEFNVDDLKWCIENHDPVNAIIAYNGLVNRDKVQLDTELLLQFFELICYTNEETPLGMIEHQKSYFTSRNDLEETPWRKTGLASKIFNQIKENIEPSRVYSAMISGLSKHNEFEAAHEIFKEFVEFHPSDGLNINAYEYLLHDVGRHRSSKDLAVKTINEVVQHMENYQVKPSLEIFNSILQTYRGFSCDTADAEYSHQLVTDMIALDIRPSPFTYACLIQIIQKSRGSSKFRPLIEKILDHMMSEDDAVTIRDERDTTSLAIFMRIFASYMHDTKLASIAFKLHSKCPELVDNAAARSGFFDRYFELLLATEKLDNITQFYLSHVPLQFVPSENNYAAFAEVLDLYQASEDIIDKVGQDIINFKINSINDAIFRKNPKYVEAAEKAMQLK